MWHGCTHIAGLYPLRTVQQDFLLYGADLIAGLGFRTIKFEFSIAYNTTKYPNQDFGGTASNFTQLAQTAPFATVFSDARFDRYLLSCFSIDQPLDNAWAGKWTDTVGDAVETEMYNLAVHLATTYPTKEFVLKNWEGDWQLLNSFNPSDAQRRAWLNAYLDFQRRRQRAVRAAMRVVSTGGRVYYAVECNRVLDDYGLRVHRDVVPVIQPDMVSLSCYEAIEGWTAAGGSITDQTAIEADIAAKLASIKTRLTMEGMPNGTPVFLGEFGFPQEAPYWPGTLNAVGMLGAVVTNAQALGFTGAVYWQGLSNEEYAAGAPRGFNLWSRNGNSATVGARNALGDYYAGIL